MKLKRSDERTICLLSHPEHRIKAQTTKNGLVLNIPKQFAIELFWNNTSPSCQTPFLVKSQGKSVGLFQISDLRHPDDLYDNGLVEFHLLRVRNSKKK